MTALETVRPVLAQWPDVRLAVVFGSTARGTARRRSDLDIGVSVPDTTDLMALRVTLEREGDITVDIIRLEEAPRERQPCTSGGFTGRPTRGVRDDGWALSA
jgi:predicted nucleotidyltransferase